MKKSERLNQITKLLPEGLEPATVLAIAEMIDKLVNEQVGAQVTVLAGRVKGFLRTSIDTIKESAEKELSYENPVFRNALMMEQIKQLVSSEMTDTDDQAVSEGKTQKITEAQEESDALTSELTESVQLNESLKAQNAALNNKLDLLSEGLKKAKVAIQQLAELKKKPFKSSEQGKLAGNLDELKQKQNTNEGDSSTPESEKNPFLTEEMMSLLPNSNVEE